MIYSFGKGSDILKNRARIKNITVTALGIVMLAICSWISIAGVTLQTFGVFFLLSYFGAKRGAVTVFVYLLMGALGIPVFSGFGGGIGWILGPTGGFLLGFLFASLLHIAVDAMLPKIAQRIAFRIPFLTACVLCCYLCGACTMYFYYLKNGSSISFFGVFLGLIPMYAVFDAVKILLACYLAKYLSKIKPI